MKTETWTFIVLSLVCAGPLLLQWVGWLTAPHPRVCLMTDSLPHPVCTFRKRSCLFTLMSGIGRDAWLDFHQERGWRSAHRTSTSPVKSSAATSVDCSNAAAEDASVGFSGGCSWHQFCYTCHKRLKDLNDILSRVLTTYFSYSLMNIGWIERMSQTYELLWGKLTCLNNSYVTYRSTI